MLLITLTCLALQLQNQIINAFDDYWDDDFDPNKNCKKEDLIKELYKDRNPRRCAVKRRGMYSLF